MKNNLVVVGQLGMFVAALATTAATAATAATAEIITDSISFSEVSGPVSFAQFNPGLGTLTNVAVRLTNLTLSQEMLIDYDDADTYGFSPFTLNHNVSFGFTAYGLAVAPPPFFIAPFVFGLTSPASPASATVQITVADDGDGPNGHNGGPDETTHLLDFTTNDALFSEASQSTRDLFTGLGMVGIELYPSQVADMAFGSMPVSPPGPGETTSISLFFPQIETFVLHESYSGTVSVAYSYVAAPEPSAILLVAPVLMAMAARGRRIGRPHAALTV